MPFFRSPLFLYRSQQWALLLMIGLFGLAIYFRQKTKTRALQPLDEKALQAAQKLWDSLHQLTFKKEAQVWSIQFNYLTDYQAYTLGISPEAYDLFKFYRKQGGWVQSLDEFQQITKLSDSVIQEIRPYFKETANKKVPKKKRVPLVKKDINTATQKDFEAIHGVGPVLAKRIIKYRTYLHGFSLLAQCSEVYGLDATVVASLQKHFVVIQPPKLPKKEINAASLYELQKTPYISKASAKKIIAFRTAAGKISVEDLTKVLDDSLNKIERIKLYLY